LNQSDVFVVTLDMRATSTAAYCFHVTRTF